MNVCIPMPDGSLHTLTDHEAQLLDAFLADREVCSLGSERAAIGNLRAQLKLALTPEAQYADVYMPHIEPRGGDAA